DAAGTGELNLGPQVLGGEEHGGPESQLDEVDVISADVEQRPGLGQAQALVDDHREAGLPRLRQPAGQGHGDRAVPRPGRRPARPRVPMGAAGWGYRRLHGRAPLELRWSNGSVGAGYSREEMRVRRWRGGADAPAARPSGGQSARPPSRPCAASPSTTA